jgi:hypothetical protein
MSTDVKHRWVKLVTELKRNLSVFREKTPAFFCERGKNSGTAHRRGAG